MITKFEQFLENKQISEASDYLADLEKSEENHKVASTNLEEFKNATLSAKDLVMFKARFNIGGLTQTITNIYGLLYNDRIYTDRGIYPAAVGYKKSNRRADIKAFQEQIYNNLKEKLDSKKSGNEFMRAGIEFQEYLDSKLPKLNASDVKVGDKVRIYYPDYKTQSKTVGYVNYEVLENDGSYVIGKVLSYTKNITHMFDMSDGFVGDKQEIIRNAEVYGEKIQ